jgi:hypothetical protein
VRPPGPRLFNLDVVVRRRSWNADAAGGRTPAAASAATLRASAQPLSAERTPEHLRDTGRLAYQVHFPSDPDVRAGDLVELPDGTALAVAAPAVDEAGRGAMWTIYATRAD